MAQKLDIVVFGATGYTGKYTLPFVYKFAKLEGRNLSWGIAGRSETKLKAVLQEAKKKIGVDKLDVPIIIADVDDEDSIKAMAQQAQLIINCCGPYLLYGEVVVKACVESGTHMVDVTGEVQFIDTMKLKYHKAAEESGSYIVSACGMDSIPSDMGVVYLENHFEGTLNSVEVFLNISDKNGWFSGSVVNFGTYQSAVLMMSKLMEKFSIKDKLNLTPLPDLKPKLGWRLPLPSKNPTNHWIIPFIGADVDIMRNSQRYFYENDKHRRPIQTNMYVEMGNPFIMLLLLIFAPVIILLCQFKLTRNFLLKFPQVFTLGYITHENPSEEKVENVFCKVTYYGEGWKEKLSEGSDQYSSQPNKSVVATMKAKSPAYGFTALAITTCALMILTEKEKLPKKGGVYTTAAAFSKTSLIQQLENNGVEFEIVSVNDL